MNKKVIMKNAWTIARQGVEKFGGKATDYISEALKQAWAIAKQLQKGNAKKQFTSKNLKGGMTSKQDWFITKLMKEVEALEIDVINEVPGVIEFLQQGIYGTSKQEASELINELLNAKKVAA